MLSLNLVINQTGASFTQGYFGSSIWINPVQITYTILKRAIAIIAIDAFLNFESIFMELSYINWSVWDKISFLSTFFLIYLKIKPRDIPITRGINEMITKSGL